ncbi:Hypothetical predicted protein, partial [Paramuricea clavata]
MGGGVAIYCRDNLPFTVVNTQDTINECLWIKLNRINCKPFIVGCAYRPPCQPVDEFLDGFNNSLSEFDSSFDKVIL